MLHIDFRIKGIFRSISIALCALLLAACSSSGGSNAEGDQSSNSSSGSISSSSSSSSSSGDFEGIIQLINLPSPPARQSSPLDSETAGVVGMSAVRLDSFASDLVLDYYIEKHPFTHWMSIYGSPYNIVQQIWDCTHFGGTSTSTSNGNDQMYSHDACLNSRDGETYRFFDGNIDSTFSYLSEHDQTVRVHYKDFFTQSGSFSDSNSFTAALFNGTVEIIRVDDQLTIFANLTIRTMVDGDIEFRDFELVRSLGGEVVSASGTLATTYTGTHNVRRDGTSLAIDNDESEAIEVKFSLHEARISWKNPQQEALGSYVMYDRVGEYNRHAADGGHWIRPVEDILNEVSSSSSQDRYFPQDTPLSIDLSRSYLSTNWNLHRYAIEIEAIIGNDLPIGNPPATGIERLIDALPEVTRPLYETGQSFAGEIALDFSRVPGQRARLITRAKAMTNLISVESDTFEIYVHGDFDADGILDLEDTDTDGDGVVNEVDDLPYDPYESVDTDSDGIGDDTDDDIDGDGVNNENDHFPYGALCSARYSGFDGRCISESIGPSSFKGFSLGGIAIEQDPVNGTIFRYDVANATYLPPVSESRTGSDKIWVSPHSDQVLIIAIEAVYTFNAAEADIQVREVISPSCSVNTSVAHNRLFENGIVLMEDCESDDGSRYFNFYAWSGELLDSFVTTDVFLSTCPAANRDLFTRCLFPESGALTLHENPLAPIEAIVPSLYSPDGEYAVRENRLYTKDGLIHAYIPSAVGFIGNDLLLMQYFDVGLWDHEQQSFSHFAQVPSQKHLAFWSDGVAAYWYAVDDSQRIISGRLAFRDDYDEDGYPDSEDDFPTDASASVDTDGDGYPDTVSVEIPTTLIEDAFPEDAKCWQQNTSCLAHPTFTDNLTLPTYQVDPDEGLYFLESNDSRLVHKLSKTTGLYDKTRAMVFPFVNRAYNPRISDYSFSPYTDTLYVETDYGTFAGDVHAEPIQLQFAFDLADLAGYHSADLEFISGAGGKSFFAVRTVINDTLGFHFVDESDRTNSAFIALPTVEVTANGETSDRPLSSAYWSAPDNTLWLAGLYNQNLYYCHATFTPDSFEFSTCDLADPIPMEVGGQPDRASLYGEFTVAPGASALSYGIYHVDLASSTHISTSADSPRTTRSYWYDDGYLLKYHESPNGSQLFNPDLALVQTYQEIEGELVILSDGPYVVVGDYQSGYELVPFVR